ncbi:hypothetical protein ASPVEDRAFT_82333 [Aspergillus versicolor CBS 583.65]|uniref:Zn(2)-C6 fungal-type domain-containing protein n=1 Tax=Aspergillus versicolor CBS 583.65 TaxID=1036611 RepID=A0A1L9PGX3_ASPVE|nr:uncharacterized protein ASPVEDRAFT_82333 [Aspergillus versicolor CBS 583.65]OJJ00777.1 hypothetical protein ASPVEDRAFT_82333 [Aspergillus versicolor CBS 583.65]
MSSPRPCKRQRICRACDQCRRRKSKCDGEQPVCRICQAAGRNCSYENGGGRRGLPTGYVRGLETALGLMFQKNPSCEKDLLVLLRERRTAASRNRAVDRWRNSKAATILSQSSPAGPGDLSTEENVDDDGEWVVDEKHNAPSEQESAAPRPNEAGIIQKTPSAQTECNEAIDMPLPSNTSELLDVYFVYTHSWFPILERRVLLRAMYTYPGEQPFHSSCHFVLWAVIAYASLIKGDSTLTVTPTEISLCIRKRILSNSMTLDLDVVRALIILVLVHLDIGDIQLAWVLIGQAARMLYLLPKSSQTGRFRNAFHGCMFLDTVISAFLGRAPSLSTEEQLSCGPVEEDDMEEWDSWSISGNVAGRGPLQSLSIFNRLRQLTQVLSSILYHSDHGPAHSSLGNIIEKTKAVLERHPYTGRDSATPPLLTLHLTTAFVIMTAIHRFEISDPSALAETSHCLMGLLGDYTEVMKSSRASPLLRYFALQCQYCLEVQPQSYEIVVLRNRISSYLEEIPGSQITNNKAAGDSSLLASVTDINSDRSHIIGKLNAREMPFLELESYPQSATANTMQMPYATPVSNIENLTTDKPYVPPSLGEADAFDELFEELVTSIPSARLEPEFAHNLGFYAGDLDTDFMTQLQRSPNG